MNIDLEHLRSIPKADLHVHLEGSVSLDLLRSLASKNGIALETPVRVSGPREIPAPQTVHLEAPFRSGDFFDFIRVYVKISECLKTAADFCAAGREYARRAAEDGVVAAEMYVTPTTLLSLGTPEDELFLGLQQAEAASRAEGVELRWIFDIVRNSPRPGDETIDAALRARANGVAVSSIGLAGLEAGYPATRFAQSLRRAKAEGFALLIHAGETAPASSVRDALESGPPDRIGHGVTAAGDPAVLQELAERAIPLELCPASNLALGVLSPESTALRSIAAAGVRTVIATDDPGIFGASLLDNFALAANLGMSADELERAARLSLQLFRAGNSPRLSLPAGS